MAPSVDMLKKAFEETQHVIDQVTPGHMAQQPRAASGTCGVCSTTR